MSMRRSRATAAVVTASLTALSVVAALALAGAGTLSAGCDWGCDSNDDGCGGVPYHCPSDTCSGRCVVLASDPQNCGTCGTVCDVSLGLTCTAGVCASGSTCGAGLASCGTPAQCVNLAQDDKNCGSCGNACRPAETCFYGKCVSPCPPQHLV